MVLLFGLVLLFVWFGFWFLWVFFIYFVWGGCLGTSFLKNNTMAHLVVVAPSFVATNI